MSAFPKYFYRPDKKVSCGFDIVTETGGRSYVKDKITYLDKDADQTAVDSLIKEGYREIDSEKYFKARFEKIAAKEKKDVLTTGATIEKTPARTPKASKTK